MHFLNYYNQHIVKYDSINKFRYKKLTAIPKIKFISLRIQFRKYDLKSLITGLAGIEMITSQKGTLIKSKVSNVSLRIRKGQPIGCKVILCQEKMLCFLVKLINYTNYQLSISILKDNNKQQNMLSLNFSNILIFNVLEQNYQFFKNLNSLDINIVTTPCSYNDFLFLLKSYKLRV